MKNAVIKDSALATLIEKIDAINLVEVNTNVLEDFMEATKVLEDFTKNVKGEIMQRLENGEEINSYTISTRTTRKISDVSDTINNLTQAGYEMGEIADFKLKSPKELLALVGSKNESLLNIEENTTKFIKRKAKKK